MTQDKDLLTELANYLIKQFIWTDPDKVPKDECKAESEYIINLFQLLGWKSPEKCKSCADGFISTHENATNAVRQQTLKEVMKYLEKRYLTDSLLPSGNKVLIIPDCDADWQTLKSSKLPQEAQNAE